MRTVVEGLDTGRIARRFHALSDEKRLRILELLREGERCVCELTDALGAGQSLLSFHLKTLKEAGLVTDRREGRWVYYAADAEALAEAEDAIAALAPASGGATDPDACCG